MFNSVFIIKAVTVPPRKVYFTTVRFIYVRPALHDSASLPSIRSPRPRGRVATSYGFKERTILYTTVLASTVYRVKRVRLRLLYRATALPLAPRRVYRA